MRKTTFLRLFSGVLFIGGFALLILVGKHVFAAPNATGGTGKQTKDRATKGVDSFDNGAVLVFEGAPEDAFHWHPVEPGAKIAAGANASAVLSLDWIADGGAGNRRDDGVTTGTVSGRGTTIAIEVFATGVRTSLRGMIIKFDFDVSFLAFVKAENSAFPLAIPDASVGANLAATTPATLAASGFLARAEFETVADVTGREFSIGIESVTLAESSASIDEITTSRTITFNTVPSPDFDGDGTVGFSDFVALASVFGSQQGDANFDARFDLNGDGSIGFSDFVAFAADFGKTVEPPPPGGGTGGGGGSGNTYGVGESLPDFPSGFFVPRLIRNASLTVSGGRAVLSFQNGGHMELQDGTAYTCIAAQGCSVEGGRVTSGTIRLTGSGGGGGNRAAADLVVESPSVTDNTLTTGQSFNLEATVRNRGTGSSSATTLRYYSSSNATISGDDTEVGTDSVDGLAASATSVESTGLTAPSSAGHYYYGACVDAVSGESDTGNNCSAGVSVTVSSGGGDVPSAVVTIPDANLRAVIADSLGKAHNAPITRAEMATLTRIGASNKDIRELTGLEFAINLTWLNLGGEVDWFSPSGITLRLDNNAISDVSPLSRLTNLTWLNLSGNDFSDISPLSNLTNLTSLTLINNTISNLSPLTNLSNLEFLDLSGNSLANSNLSPLTGLTSLTDLNLSYNNLSDLIPLASLTNLSGELSLGGNDISNLTPLSGLTNLTDLDLSDNNISDLTPLSGLTNLSGRLLLRGNNISDLTPLSGLTNLRSLFLSDNDISDLTPLANLTNLRSQLWLSGNNISDLTPLSGLINLWNLTLEDNSISDISPLSYLTNLSWLDLSGNRISDVSALSNLTNLAGLQLSRNSISDISPSPDWANFRDCISTRMAYRIFRHWWPIPGWAMETRLI